LKLSETHLGPPEDPLQIAVNTKDSINQLSQDLLLFCGPRGRSFAVIIVLPGCDRRNVRFGGHDQLMDECGVHVPAAEWPC